MRKEKREKDLSVTKAIKDGKLPPLKVPNQLDYFAFGNSGEDADANLDKSSVRIDGAFNTIDTDYPLNQPSAIDMIEEHRYDIRNKSLMQNNTSMQVTNEKFSPKGI